jgi:hypothetical protein
VPAPARGASTAPAETDARAPAVKIIEKTAHSIANEKLPPDEAESPPRSFLSAAHRAKAQKNRNEKGAYPSVWLLDAFAFLRVVWKAVLVYNLLHDSQ